MEQIYQIRGVLINFAKKYENILKYTLKFILMLFVFTKLNQSIGNNLTNKFTLSILLAAFSIVLPQQWILFLLIGVIGVNLALVSIEASLVITLFLLVIFVLYVRMFPEHSYIILAVPICFMLHIPLIVPILVALFLGIQGLIPVGLGVVIWYSQKYLTTILEIKKETLYNIPEVISKIYSTFLNSLMSDREMFLSIVVFAFVIVLVWGINKVGFDYASYIAVIAALLINIIGFIMGIIILGLEVNPIVLIFQSLIAAGISIVVLFFKVALNYSRTEKVEFEDDDYYYFVKAVPKIKVQKARRNIKKITESKNHLKF